MDASKAKDVENLKNLLKRIAEEQDYKNAGIDVQPISTGGANYSSELYIATISDPLKEDLKLFAKIACLGEELRNSNENVGAGFKAEIIFYSKLAVIFEEFYNNNGVEENDRLYIPKYYGHEFKNHRETIVLENLVVKGFGDFDRMKTFDWDYASAAITEVAKFHALGIVGKLNKLEILKEFKMTDFFANENNVKVFKDQALCVGELVKDEYKDKVNKYFESGDFDNVMKLFWKAFDYNYYIHGDFRPSNLLHRNVKGKFQAIPVDYQTMRLGSLVFDLMYFIWSGSDSKFREKYYKQAIEHYYTELTKALKNLHIDIKEVYPRNVFEEQLEDCKLFGLFVGLTLITILTVDPENAPKLDSFSDFRVTPNKIALQRINEILEDYVKWGII